MTTLYKPTETMTAVDAILEIYTEEELFDIAYHGCASGCASSHIYTSDCVKFFDEYEYEILEYIEENLGYESAFELTTECGSIDQVKNTLVWIFIELIATSYQN
jgi:hypothetical protein